MSIYLLIGGIFWLTLSFVRYRTFKYASNDAVFRGFLIGVLLWPLAIPFVIAQELGYIKK